jgi:hypothetical protein
MSIPGPSPFAWGVLDKFGKNAELISGFAHESFFFLNSKIYASLERGEDIQVNCGYLISFDTNAASHLRALFSGINSSSIQDLAAFLDHFDGNRLNWQILPYLLENLSLIMRHEIPTEVIETVAAVESLGDIDREYYQRTGTLRQRSPPQHLLTAAENTIRQFRSSMEKGGREILELREAIYVCILKAAQLQFYWPSRNEAFTKFKEMARFMDEELHCMMITVLKILWLWFSADPEAALFGPLQKGSPHLITKANNIAWDIFHLIRLPQEMVLPIEPGAFLIPYFLTFDKALNKLMRYCGMRLCLAEPRYLNPYTVQEVPIDPIVRFVGFLDEHFGYKYFSADANLRRIHWMDKAGPPNLSALRQHLERSLTS